MAKQVLRAEKIRFFRTAIITAYPQPNTPFSFEQHVDIQYCRSDFEATPRNIVCSYFLWLSDVPEKRAPMMYRPGSHWLLADYRENDPNLRGVTPTVRGETQEQLPVLDYAEAVPVTAKAGEVSVFTTATVHGASVNVDTEPRKLFVITFTAAGVKIGLPQSQEEQRLIYNQELRQRLRPERDYIVPDD